jgi:hypothetical protein
MSRPQPFAKDEPSSKVEELKSTQLNADALRLEQLAAGAIHGDSTATGALQRELHSLTKRDDNYVNTIDKRFADLSAMGITAPGGASSPRSDNSVAHAASSANLELDHNIYNSAIENQFARGVTAEHAPELFLDINRSGSKDTGPFPIATLDYIGTCGKGTDRQLMELVEDSNGFVIRPADGICRK